MREWGNPDAPAPMPDAPDLPAPDTSGLEPGGLVVQACGPVEVVVDTGSETMIMQLAQGEHVRLPPGHRFLDRHAIGAPGCRTIGLDAGYELVTEIDPRGSWRRARPKHRAPSLGDGQAVLACTRQLKDAERRVARLRQERQDNAVALTAAEAQLETAKRNMETLRRELGLPVPAAA
jgi:hypothetical protein